MATDPNGLTAEQQAALHAYWAALTPEDERFAYENMMRLGVEDAYGASATAADQITRDFINVNRFSRLMFDRLVKNAVNAPNGYQDLRGEEMLVRLYAHVKKDDLLDTAISLMKAYFGTQIEREP